MGMFLWGALILYFLLGIIAAIAVLVYTLFRKRALKAAHVAVIEVNGIIMDDKSGSGKFARFMKEVEQVRALKVPVLILRINSPGGTIVASERMYAALKNLRKDGIKIVALMEEVAASGGFYIAMAADKIVASEGTVTGSIGVILQNLNITVLLGILGIKAETIKSGKFKDSLSRTREITDEDRNALREVVLDMHDQFCKIVADSRHIAFEEVQKLESRILSGKQAKNLKLVDEVGHYEDALRIAKEISGISEETVRVATFSQSLGKVKKFRAGSIFEEMLFRAKHPGTPLWLLDRF